MKGEEQEDYILEEDFIICDKILLVPESFKESKEGRIIMPWQRDVIL